MLLISCIIFTVNQLQILQYNIFYGKVRIIIVKYYFIMPYMEFDNWLKYVKREQIVFSYNGIQIISNNILT